MEDSHRIRRAGHEDVERIVDLWSDLLDFHLAFDAKYEKSADAKPGFARHLHEYVGAADRVLLVVEVDGEVVGFTNGLLAQYPPCLAHRAHGYLDNMMVAAEHRRRGLGAALFEAAMDWFREQGVPTVEARVHMANAASRAFCRKVGLTPYMELLRTATRASGSD